MAKGHHFDSHFQDVLNNLDVELIAPLLITSGIISADDQASLREKSKISAVKFILRKVKNYDNGDVMFKECLKNTSDKSQNHRNLVLILYDSKGKSLYIYIYIYIYLYIYLI